MGKFDLLFDRFIDKFISRSKYSEAERSGVKKYLRSRAKTKLSLLAVFSVILLVALLVLSTAGVSCLCARDEIVGTWVLVEDYEDGFDSDDCYIEFRDIGAYYREAYYRNGEYVGELSYNNGRVYERRSYIGNRSLERTTISFDSGRLILERQGYETVTISQFGTIETDTVASYSESFIRISKDCNLTDEQRAALY